MIVEVIVNKVTIKMLEEARDIEKILNAIKLIGERINELHADIEKKLKSEINKTSLKLLFNKANPHPLAIPRTLLDGTQWEYDEPTLTRLLATALESNCPFSSELVYFLFSEYFPGNKIGRKEFVDLVKNRSILLTVDTEVYSGKKEQKNIKTDNSKKGKDRRSDILISIQSQEAQFPRLNLKILIEAKVRSILDKDQLEDLSEQFKGIDSDWLFLFLHSPGSPMVNMNSNKQNETEDYLGDTHKNNNNEKDSIDLPPDWEEYLWENVVLAFEKLLNRISIISEDKIQLHKYDVFWIKLLMGTFWKGTLGISLHSNPNLFSLFSNTHFMSILKKLQEGKNAY